MAAPCDCVLKANIEAMLVLASLVIFLNPSRPNIPMSATLICISWLVSLLLKKWVDLRLDSGGAELMPMDPKIPKTMPDFLQMAAYLMVTNMLNIYATFSTEWDLMIEESLHFQVFLYFTYRMFQHSKKYLA